MCEVLIDRPSEWLENVHFVNVDGIGKCEILTANRHGDLQVSFENEILTVNISHNDVEVL